MRLNRIILLGWTVGVLAWAGLVAPGQAHADAGDADEQARVLAMADRVMREANRQHAVQQQTGRVLEQLDAIVAELTHNDLLERGNAEQLVAVSETLRRVHGQHVPQAAEHLRDARRQLQAMRPRLSAAGDELDLVLEALQQIVEQYGTRVRTQALSEELRSLVDQEQALHEQTEEWGRETLTDPESAEAQREPIADRQQQLADAFEQFQQMLEQSRDGAIDRHERERVEQASEQLAQRAVREQLVEAAAAIRADDPFAALDQQEAALEAMHDALAELEREPELPDPSTMPELAERGELADVDADAADPSAPMDLQPDPRAELAQLRGDHDALAEAAQAAADAGEDVDAHQPAQAELADEAAAMAQRAVSPAAQSALQAVHDAMQQAADAMAAGDTQAMAEAHADVTAALDQADAATDEAYEQFEQMLAAMGDLDELVQQQAQLIEAGAEAEESALPELGQEQATLREAVEAFTEELPGPWAEPLEQASTAMADAAEAFEQPDAEAAATAQDEAMSALLDARQAMAEAFELLAEDMPAMMAAMAEADDAQDQPAGPAPAGDSPAAGDGRWQTLGARDRQQLQQRFARELPVEHRQLLEAYYEALAE